MNRGQRETLATILQETETKAETRLHTLVTGMHARAYRIYAIGLRYLPEDTQRTCAIQLSQNVAWPYDSQLSICSISTHSDSLLTMVANAILLKHTVIQTKASEML